MSEEDEVIEIGNGFCANGFAYNDPIHGNVINVMIYNDDTCVEMSRQFQVKDNSTDYEALKTNIIKFGKIMLSDYEKGDTSRCA